MLHLKWSTTVSTLTSTKLTQGAYPGCLVPLTRTRGYALCLSHPGQSWGHRLRRWNVQGTPRPRTGTKSRYSRGYLTRCPAASTAAGPRHWGACSPGGGLKARLLLPGLFPGNWTQKCVRRAYTGCSQRQTVHMPPGSQRPPLGKQRQTTVS